MELEGINTNSKSKLIVIGATNFMSSIDNAIKRSGRLGCHIEVNPPTSAQQRFDIFKAAMRKERRSENDVISEEDFGVIMQELQEVSLERFTDGWV